MTYAAKHKIPSIPFDRTRKSIPEAREFERFGFLSKNLPAFRPAFKAGIIADINAGIGRAQKPAAVCKVS